MSDEGTTLEARWIRPGALTTSMIEWFGPVPGEIESREDVYLVTRRVEGLSLKIRGGVRLDVKVADDNAGVIDVPGRARATIQSWQKWSFPLPAVLATGIESPDWISVRKIRRIRLFSFAAGVPAERADAGQQEASCAVELTDVSVGDERWWTLGLEAIGRPIATPMAIDAAAQLIFGGRMPEGLELGAADAMSYTDWLRNRRSEGRHVG